MESKIITSDFKSLDAFVKGVQGGFVVRVGIMGKKNARDDSKGKTNADIGFIHEFGRPQSPKSPAIPQRSFLRMPILAKAPRILKETAEQSALKNLAKGNVKGLLRTLGIACERAILDAFDSKGFGQWAANAPSTIRRKGGRSTPLIDLGFLRKSISSEVVAL